MFVLAHLKFIFPKSSLHAKNNVRQVFLENGDDPKNFHRVQIT